MQHATLGYPSRIGESPIKLTVFGSQLGVAGSLSPSPIVEITSALRMTPTAADLSHFTVITTYEMEMSTGIGGKAVVGLATLVTWVSPRPMWWILDHGARYRTIV